MNSSNKLTLPALYYSANNASAAAQRNFWWTIRAEYFFLLCAAVLSSTMGLSGSNKFGLTILLVILAGLFVFKVYKKLDQDWYRCRALAESVKTSTWRFVMRAHPFEDAESVEQPKAEFRNILRDILKINHHLAERLDSADAEQFTESMLEIRQLPLERRIEYYIQNRIDDQRSWYSKKSVGNKKSFRFWVFITITVYLLAAISLNIDKETLPWARYAFDPLIVVVTSIIGWVQMKRHSELTASYNLTAHEIGIIRSNSAAIKTESGFSDFVNEAELAFSREHTQWVARRDAT